jgi:exodeoxyribonuclease VII small subunit
MMEKKTKYNFEKSIIRLQEISELLESEDIALEEAINLYEEGVLLSKTCIDELKRAELKISHIKAKAQEISAENEVEEKLNGENL